MLLSHPLMFVKMELCITLVLQKDDHTIKQFTYLEAVNLQQCLHVTVCAELIFQQKTSS